MATIIAGVIAAIAATITLGAVADASRRAPVPVRVRGNRRR